MDWKNIDKRLSQHHDGESYPVDTDELWAAIEPHIPTKKPNRKLPFLLLIPALLSLVGGAYFLGYTNATQNQKDDIVQVDTPAAIQQSIRLYDRTVDNDSSSDATAVAEKNEYNYSDTRVDIAEANSKVTLNKPVNSINQSAPSIINSSSQHDRSFTIADRTGLDGINSIVGNQGLIGTGASNVGLGGNKYLSSTNQSLSEIIDRTDLTENTANSIVETFSLAKLWRAIDPLHVELGNLPDAPESVPLQSYYNSYKNKSKYYVELTAGVSRVTSGLSLEGPSFQSNAPGMNNIAEVATQLTNRRIAESKLFSFTGDFKVGYKFNENISVQSGLTFAQLAKRSGSTLEFTREVELDDVLLREIVTVDGVMQVFGAATVSERVTQRVSRVNKFNQLLLPVSLLYRNKLDKIYYDLEVGGAISLTQNYSGFIHPSEIEEYSLSADVDDLYRDGSNTYLILGGGIGIPFSERIELVSRLNYYQQLNKINSENSGIGEKLSFLKLQIGLRHNF
jgi:hypothetical protein